MVSQRFVRLGMDLKTNAMLFSLSEIFGMFAGLQFSVNILYK